MTNTIEKININENENLKENEGKKNSGIKIQLKKINIPPEKKIAFLSTAQATTKMLKTSFIQAKKFKKSHGSSIPLSLYDDVQFIGQIEIGEPKQTIPVILDTGSGNILILSNRCKSNVCKNNKSYDYQKSNTYHKIGDKIEIDFVSGGVDGEISKDDISIGNITVPQQTFGEILSDNGNIFDDAPFSGILGLGYPELAIPGIDPIMNTIMSNDLMEKNIITFYFGKNGGQGTFGYIDDSKYKGKIKYYDVIDKYYWTIEIKDILLNGTSLGFCSKDHICKAAVDTGTSLISGPSKYLNELFEKILVDDECNGLENAPIITFVFGDGDKYDLLPEEYILQYSQRKRKQCKAMMIPVDVDEPHGPLWILGVLFMQKFYTVFDRDNNKVGFAIAKN